MYKRIFFLMGIVLSVGVLLGYGREVVAFQSQIVEPKIAEFENRVPNDVITETIKFLPPAGAGLEDGHYGRAVLLDGDTLFVGQSPVGNYPHPGYTPGSVFVYSRHAGGPNNWGLTNVITPSDSTAGNGDGFGSALAISGSTLIVGAGTGDGNSDQTGTAYIFERNVGGPDNWGQVAKLVAADGAYWDRFGWAVDIDGDTAVVGARWDNNGNGDNAGAIYIFDRNAGGPDSWGQVRKVIATDGDPSDRLGQRVAIAGDIVVAGADGQDTNGTESGSVYIFERNTGGSNNWGQVAQIYPNPSGANYQFGMSVDIEGNLLAVGAIQASPNPGAVYLFDRHAGGTNNWGQIAHIVPSDGMAGDRFGILLELEAGRLIVGAQYGDGITVNSGTAYLFERDVVNPAQWVEVNKLIASDGAANDWFSWGGVSISGGTMAVGAFLNDDFCPSNPDCDSGSAYLFTVALPSDVAINKAVSSITAVPAQPITYTLTFTNNSLVLASGTVITDLIPATILNPIFTSSGVTVTPTGSTPFVWQVADMAPGTGGVITVTGIISPELLSETTIVNTAVISNSADITPTNNSSTAVTQVIIPQINLSAADYVVDEDAGQIMVTAVLSPAQPFLDVTVAYETSDGTAVAGEDYTAVSGILTFTGGATEAQLLVPILDDQLVEPDETFMLALSNPVHATLGNVAEATITILDEDTYPEINLSAADYAVLEDAGQVVLTATLSHSYPDPVSVAYETSDGTAVAGEDYTIVTGILTFTTGTTEAQILVPILDDQLVEPDETFSLELSDPIHATLGNIVNAGITILDNDGFPSVSLSSDQFAVPEDVGQAVFTVTLSHDYPEPVSLTYETTDGTAVVGSDYTQSSGILTLSAGTTQATFVVPITDDELVEDSETFVVSLTNLTNATSGANMSATVTIVDNDEEVPSPTTSYLYLPLVVRPTPTPPPSAFPIFVSAGVEPRPVLSQGEVFFTATIQIPADLPPTGQFFLSADPDQLTAVSVDDELAFVMNGQEIFVHRFSIDGQTIYPAIVPLPRQTMELMAGQTVTVVFRDVFSDQVSATSLWIVHIP